MNHLEKRSTLAIAGIFCFRMLGLFMILPIFSAYSKTLTGSTPFLAGLALGIYGLSQGLLQIPFGTLSDKVGRKPVILGGLILFVAGSLIAAMSHTMLGVIIGRCLQGAGAIGSTCMALLADNTQDENRSRAMAMIGMTIATSFFLAMIVGPIIAARTGLQGLFYLTALFAAIGVLLVFIVPTPQKITFHTDNEARTQWMSQVLKNKELLRLNISIFLSHAILTTSFVSLPLMLLQIDKVSLHQQWIIYLPALVCAYIAIFPCIMIAEIKRCLKQAFILAVLIVGLSQLSLGLFSAHIVVVGLSLFFFLTAFSFLEATLPSLVSRIAPVKYRGTAIGIYSSFQFLGIFCGGLIGGYFTSHHQLALTFLFLAVITLIWLLFVIPMKQPPYLSLKIISLQQVETSKIENLQAQLLKIPGVKDVAFMPIESTLYLKVDKKLLDEQALQEFICSMK